MAEDRRGSLLDISFILKSGRETILKGVMIKVFDAFRQMKTDSFDKRFIWGELTGVDVNEVAAWTVIGQYDDDDEQEK